MLSEAVKKLGNHSDVKMTKIAGGKAEQIRWRDGCRGFLMMLTALYSRARGERLAEGRHLMPWERGQCRPRDGEGMNITLSLHPFPSHRVSVTLSLD